MFQFPKPSELQQKRLNPFSSQAGVLSIAFCLHSTICNKKI